MLSFNIAEDLMNVFWNDDFILFFLCIYQDVMLRHDLSLELVDEIDFPPGPPSSQGNVSNALSLKLRPPPSVKPSEKSAGAFSLRHFISERLKTTVVSWLSQHC